MTHGNSTYYVIVVNIEESLPSANSLKCTVVYRSVQDGDGLITAAWSRWTDLHGVIHDKKVRVKLKRKLRKTVVYIILYGGDCWPMRKQEYQRVYTTQMTC